MTTTAARHAASARRALRRLAVAFGETSPRWAPTLPGPPEPVHPASEERVLHLLKASLPYRQSGYTVRTAQTMAAQQAVGLDPVAMTALDFPRELGVTDVPAEEEVGGVRHLRLDRPAVPTGQRTDRYLADWALAAAPRVREVAPAVIHVHSGHRGFDAPLVGLALGRHADLPVVYEVRGFFEALATRSRLLSERSPLTRRRRAADTRCMLAADAVVTLSETMSAEIVARGVPADRVHVVPNAVDVDAFRPRPRRADLVDRHGLAGRFVFGYVSNLDHYREGQELLVEAVARLRPLGIPATALVVGDGPRRAVLEERAARLGVEDAVVLTGRVPHAEVADYYALMDVFVVPRVDDHASRLVTPLKPLEAMAVGRPVVVSDLPALGELVGSDRGHRFRAGDVDALVDVLRRLRLDPALGRASADRAREWVVAQRQWSHNAERYRTVYAQVLTSRGSSARG